MYKTVESYNPFDHRQFTDRAGATWGVPRTGYNLYEKHYADHMDDVEPTIETKSLDSKEQLIYNAKRWAHKKFPELDYEEVDQEIDIKVWLLEDHELNLFNEWERPKYVMTALKNVINNYAKKEIAYIQRNALKDTIEIRYKNDLPMIEEDIVFNIQTLKAALALYIVSPYILKHETRERVSAVYLSLTKSAHKALIQTILSPNYIATRDLHRALDKIIQEVEV